MQIFSIKIRIMINIFKRFQLMKLHYQWENSQKLDKYQKKFFKFNYTIY